MLAVQLLGVEIGRTAIVAVLVVLGVAWAIGKISESALKAGAVVVGLAAMFGLIGKAWKHRAAILDGIGVSALAVTAVAAVVALVLLPTLRWGLTFALLIIGPVVLIGLDHAKTGGGSWSEAARRAERLAALRRAVAEESPEGKVGRPRVLEDGAIVVPVEHVGDIDPERVGRRVHAAEADIEPGDRMGHSRIVVRDEPTPEVEEAAPGRWDGVATSVEWIPPSDRAGR